jgi:hypothetical protein
MIHNLGINKKRMIVVNRKTQKELSDKTGLEKFSHFNRIDHFFLRKGYVPIVKNVPLNMFQVESINEQLNKDAATVDFHVLK